MNTRRVEALMAQPALVEATDREGLSELVKRYPYVPGLSMLLARASQLAGHVDQQKDLLRAASLLENRDALFDLLVRPELLKEAKTVFQAVSTSVGLPEPEAQSNVLDVTSEDENADSLSAETEVSEDMNREVLLSAIESTIELDVVQWEANRQAETKGKVSGKTDAAESVEDPPLETRSERGQSDFSAWLKKRAEAVSFGMIGGEQNSEKEKTFLGAGAKPDVHVLIDRFLEVQPKMGPIREVDKRVEELAKESVLEDKTLVTETMARVFAKQGQMGKAKWIYRELALKYPAKSTYFAAQLKKLGKGD